MKRKLIFDFLSDIAVHNNRAWFVENKARYDEARYLFENMVQQVINRFGLIDETIAHIQVKDATYRFYRDIRFSDDKSPFKRHFGAYINARGKKSFHSGYYLHLQPDACMLAGGAWCLPTSILRAVRSSIIDSLPEFRAIVEEPKFKSYFPVIGDSHLKTFPKGVARDFPFPEYLRAKDYSVAHLVPDTFFTADDWLERTCEVFHLMKPFNDFVNETIDDYI